MAARKWFDRYKLYSLKTLLVLHKGHQNMLKAGDRVRVTQNAYENLDIFVDEEGLIVTKGTIGVILSDSEYRDYLRQCFGAEAEIAQLAQGSMEPLARYALKLEKVARPSPKYCDSYCVSRKPVCIECEFMKDAIITLCAMFFEKI